MGTTRTGRGRLYVAAGLIIGALALAGCGGSDDPEVCSSFEDLQASVTSFQELELQPTEESVSELDDALAEVESDVETVKEDAGDGALQEPVTAFETAIANLRTAFDAATADGSPSADELSAVAGAAADASSSWDSLQQAAATECDL